MRCEREREGGGKVTYEIYPEEWRARARDGIAYSPNPTRRFHATKTKNRNRAVVSVTFTMAPPRPASIASCCFPVCNFHDIEADDFIPPRLVLCGRRTGYALVCNVSGDPEQEDRDSRHLFSVNEIEWKYAAPLCQNPLFPCDILRDTFPTTLHRRNFNNRYISTIERSK